MADASQIAPTLIPLVSVVVGGIIGLAGGLIGPLLLERRKQEAERKKKREEKSVELICPLYEHKHWLNVMESLRIFGGAEQRPITPFAKAQAIAHVYFPQFETPMDRLESAAAAYETWMLRKVHLRFEDKPLTPELILDADFDETYKAYLVAFNSLLKVIKDYAQREFQ